MAARLVSRFPSILHFLYDPQKEFVDPRVPSQLRMKRRCQHVGLSNGNWTPVLQPRKNVNVISDVCNDWSANEHPAKRPALDTVDFQIDLEAVDLPSESVPAHLYVHEAKRPWSVIQQTARQDDHPRASAPNRHPFPHKINDRVAHVEYVKQLHDGRALPPGYHQAIQSG